MSTPHFPEDLNTTLTTISPINVNNVSPPSEDQCIICLESLASAPASSLPECDHKFHTNCIIHWFRQGNSKCPLCNHTGAISQSTTAGGRTSWYTTKERYHTLRRFSRKKGAPRELKAFVSRLQKLEERYRETGSQLRAFRTERTGLFGALLKEYHKLQSKRRRLLWKQRQMKNTLGASCQVIPIILVEKRII